MEDIYKLFLNELDFYEQNSLFTHKKAHSISDTGDLTEMAIRKFLREVISERFKVTHGYIYSTSKKKLSPQIDIIITDTLVPHSLKKFEYLDNMEIVPVEAVVGIFEVKRKLTKVEFQNAIKHLTKIFDFVPLKKDLNTKYLPGGMILGHGINGGQFSNPFIGIVSLLNASPKSLDKIDIPWFIDMVYSCGGYLKAPKDNNSLKVYSYKTTQDKHTYYIYDPERTKLTRVKILQGFIAYLLRYLSEVSGRTFDMNDYFS